MITNKRMTIAPVEYQWALDYWYKQKHAEWIHTEIDMTSDGENWNFSLNEKEKNLIGNILKGFAQTEAEVEDYWTTRITKWFPKPEIKDMAIVFGAMESTHKHAYKYLNEKLGLDDFEAFLQDETTMNKLSVLMDINEWQDVDDPKEIARAIAVFSVCAEGIQLFSSFAILLSFRLRNLLKGTGQQIFFSVRDESMHSEAGCKIFNVLCQEYLDLGRDLREEVKNSIYEAIDLSLNAEFAFIDKVFEMGDLENLTKDQLKNFMYDRANRKLVEIGYPTKYVVDEKMLREMQWFYAIVSGEQRTDFFSNRETGYAKAGSDWHNETHFEFVAEMQSVLDWIKTVN